MTAEVQHTLAKTEGAYDVEAIRADFPILTTEMRGKPLIFLDSAASAQKPSVVLDAMHEFHSHGYASVHRGVYQLSADATRRFEAVREKGRRFLGAADEREIIFLRNATEAINLVAYSWGEMNVDAGDEIVISEMEHHANIVPWQILCERKGARLRVAPIDDDGVLDRDALRDLLGARTKLLALSHVSNVLGTVNPVKEIIAEARELGITTLLDGAQAAPHEAVDVRDLGCDFYTFSGTKLFGPGGASLLYGKLSVLESMPPFLSGGAMIESVSFEKTTYAPVPQRFRSRDSRHRLRHRPRRGDRLRRGHRPGSHRGPRARTSRSREPEALRNPRTPRSSATPRARLR